MRGEKASKEEGNGKMCGLQVKAYRCHESRRGYLSRRAQQERNRKDREGTGEEEMRTAYNAIYVCNAIIKHSMIT